MSYQDTLPSAESIDVLRNNSIRHEKGRTSQLVLWFGRRGWIQAQSSMRRPGTFPNSFTLWVINCTSRLIAWAAINMSMDPIGCPFFSSMVRTRPYIAVASRSNETTSSGETNCSKAARFLAGRLLLATPYSSSANVMTDTPMSPTECAVNRSRTEAGCSLDQIDADVRVEHPSHGKLRPRSCTGGCRRPSSMKSSENIFRLVTSAAHQHFLGRSR